jgi:hypothetical protein
MEPSGEGGTVLGMRRLIDGLLIIILLGAVGLGAYELGKRVDRESTHLSKQDSELNGTTTRATKTTTTSKKSNETPIIIAIALGGTVVLLVVGSAISGLARARKRERWHA